MAGRPARSIGPRPNVRCRPNIRASSPSSIRWMCCSPSSTSDLNRSCRLRRWRDARQDLLDLARMSDAARIYELPALHLFAGCAAPLRRPPISIDLAGCGDGGTPGKIYWTSPECPMPPEYTSFQPFIYSLDVLLPFVDLRSQ